MGDLEGHTPSADGLSSRDRAAPEVATALDRLSEALAEAGASYQSALEVVTRTTGSLLGGLGILWTADGDRHLAAAAVYASTADRLAVMTKAFAGARHSTGGGLLAAALASSTPQRFETVDWSALSGWAEAEAPGLLSELGPSALTTAVMRARGAVCGLLGLVRPAGAGALDELELSLLRQLADRSALAVDSACLLHSAERELQARLGAEEACLLAETAIAAIARSGPVLLFACDGDANIVQLDGGLLELLSPPPGELAGTNFLRLFHDYPEVADLVARALQGEQIRQAAVRAGGLHLEAWISPLRSTDGAFAGFAGLAVEASGRQGAEVAVLEAVRRQAALVEHAADVTVVLGPDGRVRYANPAAGRVLGYAWRAGDVLDLPSLVHPEDRERYQEAMGRALSTPGAQEGVELRLRHADGSYRLLRSLWNNLLEDPAVAGVVLTLREATESDAVSERLRLVAERQAALAELGRWALVGLDYRDLVADAVELLVEHSGADFVHVFDAVGDGDFITLSASHGQQVDGSELLSADPTSSPASFALVTGETVLSPNLSEETRFDLPELWTRAGAASLVEVPIAGPDTPFGVLGVGSASPAAFAEEDVSFVKAVANVLAAAAARNRAEAAIRQQALQDPLTGLPNRLLLADAVGAARAAAGNLQAMSGAERSVFVLDIDRFKEINDTLGHAIGDLVLLEVARRLRCLGDPVELVARLGGDEFALVARVVQRDEADERSARAEEERLSSHILSVLGEPLDVGGVSLRLRASIGIASADVDRDGSTLEVPALLRRAEAAMYQAKTERQGVRRYSDDLERTSLSRLALASELGEAIEKGQLRLDYQPKVRCVDGAISGVEALVRWQHPTRGLLLPDVFVPLAEQTGIVRELTSWVLQRALAECASWQRAGYLLPVAINLSAGTVHDPVLLDSVMSATVRAGLPPAAIELEITESAVMRDPVGALRSLEVLNSKGVRFSLDDFGTGYSSLGYLQRLPVSSVKVDKSFVTPLARGHDSVANAIVRAVVELGHSLNLDVIAEGVDSAGAMTAVTSLGCDAMQGFYIAVPMEPQALRPWIAEHVRPPERGGRYATSGAYGDHPTGGGDAGPLSA